MLVAVEPLIGLTARELARGTSTGVRWRDALSRLLARRLEVARGAEAEVLRALSSDFARRAWPCLSFSQLGALERGIIQGRYCRSTLHDAIVRMEDRGWVVWQAELGHAPARGGRRNGVAWLLGADLDLLPPGAWRQACQALPDAVARARLESANGDPRWAPLRALLSLQDPTCAAAVTPRNARPARMSCGVRQSLQLQPERPFSGPGLDPGPTADIPSGSPEKSTGAAFTSRRCTNAGGPASSRSRSLPYRSAAVGLYGGQGGTAAEAPGGPRGPSFPQPLAGQPPAGSPGASSGEASWAPTGGGRAGAPRKPRRLIAALKGEIHELALERHELGKEAREARAAAAAARAEAAVMRRALEALTGWDVSRSWTRLRSLAALGARREGERAPRVAPEEELRVDVLRERAELEEKLDARDPDSS